MEALPHCKRIRHTNYLWEDVDWPGLGSFWVSPPSPSTSSAPGDPLLRFPISFRRATRRQRTNFSGDLDPRAGAWQLLRQPSATKISWCARFSLLRRFPVSVWSESVFVLSDFKFSSAYTSFVAFSYYDGRVGFFLFNCWLLRINTGMFVGFLSNRSSVQSFTVSFFLCLLLFSRLEIAVSIVLVWVSSRLSFLIVSNHRDLWVIRAFSPPLPWLPLRRKICFQCSGSSASSDRRSRASYAGVSTSRLRDSGWIVVATRDGVNTLFSSDASMEETVESPVSPQARQSVFDRLSKPNFDERLKIPVGLKSTMDFAAVVGKHNNTNLKFFPLKDKAQSSITIPVELARNAAKSFKSTLYGYFLGPRLPFAVVQRCIKTMWSKYGFVDLMMNSNGFYFFQVQW